MSNEQWRDIPEWEGLYQASNLGNIRSFRRNDDGKLLTPSYDAYGYLQFSCKTVKDGIRIEKKFKVHRAVWMAFYGEIPDGFDIDHLNTVKTDNRIENLECITKQENHRRATLNGQKAHGEKSGMVKLTESEVIEIYLSSESYSTLARRYGVTSGNIHFIKSSQTWVWLTSQIERL